MIGTVLASLLVVLGAGLLPARPSRAAHDLGFPLGPFRLVERSGRAVTDADLADRVWVGSFIFTHCPLSCPRISGVMKGLQSRFDRTGVRLVSISVDPGRDTPEVLADYARRFGADPRRWWFLTGETPEVLALVRDRFKLPVEVAGPDDVAAGAEAFSHSDRLALVDRGTIVGYYSSNDPREIEALIAEATRRAGPDAPAWARRLPAVNAALNGTCAVLLLLGWSFIRARNARAHALTMISCVTVSALFLACYLVYHFEVGHVPFPGTGRSVVAYRTILLSHTLLATLGVVPLVILTLSRALRRRFHDHARIARVTFPIWLYVSVTGVVIYLMVYHWPIATSS